MWATKTWTGRDLQSHKEEQDTCYDHPPFPGQTAGVQFIKVKTMAVHRVEPKLDTAASALWFEKACIWMKIRDLNSQTRYLPALWLCTSYLLLLVLTLHLKNENRTACLSGWLWRLEEMMYIKCLPSTCMTKVLSKQNSSCLVLPFWLLMRFLTMLPSPENQPQSVTSSWQHPGQSGWRGSRLR